MVFCSMSSFFPCLSVFIIPAGHTTVLHSLYNVLLTAFEVNEEMQHIGSQLMIEDADI